MRGNKSRRLQQPAEEDSYKRSSTGRDALGREVSRVSGRARVTRKKRPLAQPPQTRWLGVQRLQDTKRRRRRRCRPAKVGRWRAVYLLEGAGRVERGDLVLHIELDEVVAREGVEVDNHQGARLQRRQNQRVADFVKGDGARAAAQRLRVVGCQLQHSPST
eukprot:3887127-Pyramimonas_sp.AAC.1